MTMIFDARHCAVSGADPAALQHYERALAAFAAWRGGFAGDLEQAQRLAPGFVMAQVMQAWLAVCSRHLERVRSARPIVARAAALPANACERLHLAAIGDVLDDDYEGAKARLGELLRLQPRDALGLQVAHALDHVTGDAAGMRARLEGVLPAWSTELPGYHAVLAMHAFALGECGEYERAEQAALQALQLNPLDARAHHAMAHVFEMSERPQDGIRWLYAHHADWSGDTLVATHLGWHLALFFLALGDVEGALQLYDERVRAERSGALGDLIDASALLWRLRLQDAEAGARWGELADAWGEHIDDGFCSFSDVHAMLAFVGAGDRVRAGHLERRLEAWQALPTRHGRSTRRLGLPACRALIAFDAGDDATAVRLLATLSPITQALGGSHAQRDVLHLTLLSGLARLRRPGRIPNRLPARVAANGSGKDQPARRTPRPALPKLSPPNGRTRPQHGPQVFPPAAGLSLQAKASS